MALNIDDGASELHKYTRIKPNINGSKQVDPLTIDIMPIPRPSHDNAVLGEIPHIHTTHNIYLDA